jgi:prepilin signal peptidase PulO-like enzyme (type II secretory pathway)
LPFGPFLAAGGVISLFCGDAVLAWYFAQFVA